jgi:hypothetical protein
MTSFSMWCRIPRRTASGDQNQKTYQNFGYLFPRTRQLAVILGMRIQEGQKAGMIETRGKPEKMSDRLTLLDIVPTRDYASRCYKLGRSHAADPDERATFVAAIHGGRLPLFDQKHCDSWDSWDGEKRKKHRENKRLSRNAGCDCLERYSDVILSFGAGMQPSTCHFSLGLGRFVRKRSSLFPVRSP